MRVNLYELTEQDRGRKFYYVNEYSGKITTYTFIELVSDTVNKEYRITVLEDGKESKWTCNYRKAGNEYLVYVNEEDAKQIVLNKEIDILKQLDSPQKTLNFIFQNGIYPFWEYSYYDIIQDSGLSKLEVKVIKEKIKEYFNIEIEDPE